MASLKVIQETQTQLLGAVEALSKGSSTSTGGSGGRGLAAPAPIHGYPVHDNAVTGSPSTALGPSLSQSPSLQPEDKQSDSPGPASLESKSGFTSRIILTYVQVLASSKSLATHIQSFSRTYPKQIGINPLPMNWGAADPQERGPVVVSRYPSTIRRRNGRRMLSSESLHSNTLTDIAAIGG